LALDQFYDHFGLTTGLRDPYEELISSAENIAGYLHVFQEDQQLVGF